MPDLFELGDLYLSIGGTAAPLDAALAQAKAAAEKAAKDISAAFRTIGVNDLEGQFRKANAAFNILSEGLDKGKVSQQQYSAATKAFNGIIQEYTDKVNGSAVSTRELQGAFRTLGVSDLEGQFRKANDAFNVFSTGFDKGIVSQRQYSEATRNFNQILQQYQRELDGTNPKMREWIAQQERAAQSQRDLEAATLHSAYILRQQSTSLTHLGAITAAAFAPAAAGIGASVKSFLDFDNAMKTSLAIMGNLSDEMKGNLATSARELSHTLTFTAKENAANFYNLASAGLSAEESIKALPVAAKFAQAGNMDLAKGTELLAQAQSALGLRIKNDSIANMQQMARVSDVLNKANILAAGTTKDFAEAITNKAGAAAREFHKPVEEVVAVLAAFHNQGIEAGKAGTYYSIVLRDLSTQAIKHADVFKQFGIAVFDSAGKLRPVADIVKDLEKAFGGMSDKQQRAALSALGLRDRSIFATQALLGLSSQIKDYQTQLENAAGTTDEISSKQLQSFSKQLELIRNRVTDVGITVGESMVPSLQFLGTAVIDPLLGRIEELAKSFKSLPKPAQDAAAAVALAGTASGVSTGAFLLFGGQILRTAADLRYLGLTATAAFGVIGAAVATLTLGTLSAQFLLINENAKALTSTVNLLSDTFGDFGKIASAALIHLEGQLGQGRSPISITLDDIRKSAINLALAIKGLPPLPFGQAQVSKPAASSAPAAKVDPQRWKEFLDMQARISEFEQNLGNKKSNFDPDADRNTKELKKHLTELSSALRELGVSENEISFDKLDKDLDMVRQAMLKGEVSADTYRKALENINQIKIERRDKDLGIKSIDQLNLDLEKAKETLDKVTSAYANNQASAENVVIASKKVDEIQAQINKTLAPLSTIWADQALAIGRVSSGFAKYGNSLDIIKQKIDTETLDALDRLNGDLDLTYNKINKLSEAGFKKSMFAFLPGAAGQIAAVAGAFDKDGKKMQSALELQGVADEAKKNYQDILSIYKSQDIPNSIVTINDVNEKWMRWIEALAAAHVKLSDSTVEAYRKMQQAMQNPLVVARQRWNDFMRDIKRLGRQFASEAFDILFPKAKPKEILDANAVASLSNATGIVGEQLNALANQIDDLAQATGGNFSSTVDKVTQQFKIWGVATVDQANALTYLYKASNLTKTGLDALTSITAEQATALKALGFDYEHAIALIGSLDASNTDSAKVLDNLTKAYQELEQKGYRDPAAALAQLIHSIQTAKTVTDANSIATKHFGDAGVFMATVIRSGKLDVDKLTAAVKASGASMHDAAEQTRKLNAEGGKVSKLTQLFRDLAREIAKMAAGQLAQGIAKVLGLENAWNKVGKAIGKAIEALLRYIGIKIPDKSIPSVPSIPGAPSGGTGPGSGKPPTGPGGSGVGTGAGGALGIVDAVTGIVTAISSVIQNFQLAKQETSLNAIEHNTRYGMLYLEKIEMWAGQTRDAATLTVRKLDEFVIPLLREIRDAAKGFVGINIDVTPTGDQRDALITDALKRLNTPDKSIPDLLMSINSSINAYGIAANDGYNELIRVTRTGLDSVWKAVRDLKPTLAQRILGGVTGGGGILGGIAGGAGSGVGGALGGLGGGLISGIIGSIFGNHTDNVLGQIEENTRRTDITVEQFRTDEWSRFSGLLKKLDDIWGVIRTAGQPAPPPAPVGNTSYTSEYEVDQIGRMDLLISKFDQFVLPKMDLALAALNQIVLNTAALAGAQLTPVPVTVGTAPGTVSPQTNNSSISLYYNDKSMTLPTEAIPAAKQIAKVIKNRGVRSGRRR